MKNIQTAARSAAARSILASAGAFSLMAASLTSIPAAFAAPETGVGTTVSANPSVASTAQATEVDPNASYEDLTYTPAPETSVVDSENPAMGAGERERMGTAHARTGATDPAAAASLNAVAGASILDPRRRYPRYGCFLAPAECELGCRLGRRFPFCLRQGY